jgi:hypothetical protein
MRDKTKHFERNNFYFGKLMTARDFTDEQRYINEKRWLVNRFGLGWGVLCGLKVRPHHCDKGKVIVEPGFAFDQYGHEILVCHEEAVELTSANDDYPAANSYLYYVAIKYAECGINPSPIPIEDCEGTKEVCVYNRIRESYRFVVTREKPDCSGPDHDPKCATDCDHFLRDPSRVISSCCPDRPDCEPVPLAAICYNPATSTTAMDIDMGHHNRKPAFSNENLYELLSCIKSEVRQGRAARTDRRRHVPLLASTIKGLTFQDGRNVKLDEDNGFEAKHPFRLTSDGDYIWITDRADEQIWRINRKTNEPIRVEELRLPHFSWGIAYDGRHMWITHHDSFQDNDGPAYGKLTRVTDCPLKARTIDGLPMCDTLPPCFRFPDGEGAPDVQKLLPNPGEIVLHDGDIYVAHEVPKHQEADPARQIQAGAQQQYQAGEQHQGGQQYGGGETGYELYVTRIDPVKGCIVEIIPIPETDSREPWSRIRAMASDGKALWITYQASSRDRRRGRIVVRKVSKGNGESTVGDPHRLSGEVPEHMVFDGTRLWVSHNDGVSIVDIETGKEEDTINSRTKHTALAYGGSDVIWAAIPGADEVFINWINIFSEEFEQWLELLELDEQSGITGFEVSDMQFDGAYIYVAYHLKQGHHRKGMIHRLLP